MYRESLQH